MYGFTKGGPSSFEFRHPLFMRGREDLLGLIRRKQGEVKKNDVMNTIKEQNEELIEEIRNLKFSQSHLAQEVAVLHQQNADMWKQLYENRMLQNDTDSKLSNLVNFLQTFFAKNSLGKQLPEELSSSFSTAITGFDSNSRKRRMIMMPEHDNGAANGGGGGGGGVSVSSPSNASSALRGVPLRESHSGLGNGDQLALQLSPSASYGGGLGSLEGGGPENIRLTPLQDDHFLTDFDVAGGPPHALPPSSIALSGWPGENENGNNGNGLLESSSKDVVGDYSDEDILSLLQ
jgi:hypothetical protein